MAPLSAISFRFTSCPDLLILRELLGMTFFPAAERASFARAPDKLPAVPDAPIVITGHAYGRRAILEITGDTLMWRAQRGARRIAENIATTVHDVRDMRWLDLAWSRGGTVLIGLGAIWAASEGIAAGTCAAAVGIGLVIWRRLQPRHFLVIDVGDRRLIMHVTRVSAPPARALAARIQRTLASGEPPQSTPTLP
jgi:hypothetical protein